MTREEAISKLHWLKAELIKGTDLNEPIDMAIEALSADDEWIPCSERLPDKDGWYLITVQGYEKVVDMEWYYGEWGAWNGVSSEQQVIAWMPLPKPYKGGDDE